MYWPGYPGLRGRKPPRDASIPGRFLPGLTSFRSRLPTGFPASHILSFAPNRPLFHPNALTPRQVIPRRRMLVCAPSQWHAKSGVSIDKSRSLLFLMSDRQPYGGCSCGVCAGPGRRFRRRWVSRSIGAGEREQVPRPSGFGSGLRAFASDSMYLQGRTAIDHTNGSEPTGAG
ncbi:MAG: hypothetical protein JWO30_4658 [Fibrobacteres bacterium]|nr:hypothetical protein [Fibrobacterota bacterium]